MPHIPLPEDPSYYPPIYAWVFQVVSFPQVSPPKTCTHLSFPPYVQKFSLHLPINIFCLTHTHTHTHTRLLIFMTIIAVYLKNYTKCVTILFGRKAEFIPVNLPVYLVVTGLKGLATFILSLTLLTCLLTPWCKVLLEQLTVLQLVKKFPAFYGTRRFITALTSLRHPSLSWASPSHLLKIHPNIIHPFTPRSPQWSLSPGFPTKTLYAPFSSVTDISVIKFNCPA